MRRFPPSAIGCTFLLLGSLGVSHPHDAQLDAGPMVGHTTSHSAELWAYDRNVAELHLELWQQHETAAKPQRCTLRGDDASPAVFRQRLAGLQAGTTYRYRLHAAGRVPVEGSFRTAPEMGQPTAFRYVVTSCMNAHQFPVQPAWDLVLEQAPALHLMLGDNVYADTTEYDQLVWHHLLQRTIPNFARLLATVPTYAIWDDHDFGPNDSHALTPGKADSLKAFRDLWANPSYGLPETPGIFTCFRWGDVDFFLLDNRYYRTDEHAPPHPDKTQFGQAQLHWLETRLKTSDASFKVVATGYDVMGSRYPDEIKQIAAIIRRSGATGVVFHAGDIHRNEFKQQDHGAGYPITQITSSGIARSPARPWALIVVDTTLDDPTMTARFYEMENLVATHTLRLSDLTPTKP